MYCPAHTRNSEGQRREFNSLGMHDSSGSWIYVLDRKKTWNLLRSTQEYYGKGEGRWEKIPNQVCLDLINSMPRRVAVVFAANGGYTKY